MAGFGVEFIAGIFDALGFLIAGLRNARVQRGLHQSHDAGRG